MYGKHFQSCYSGSMVGAGTPVFAVWGFVIANAVKGRVELNPILLSVILGTDIKTIDSAIDFLCAPDPCSRSKEHDGKRLIKEGQFQYFVPTHEHYRAIRNDDERREYFRQKQAESRARKAAVSNTSNGLSNGVKDSERQSKMSTHTEAEPKAESRGTPPISLSVPERITRERELARVESAMAKIRNRYQQGESWSTEDRLKHAELKERKAELLEILGMKV